MRGMDDFRSDLMSGPPPGMAEALSAALAAAPAFGHREDVFQQRLESAVAALMGFEDALLVPTCTIANQIALRVWGESGHRHVLADRRSHLVSVEEKNTSALNDVAIVEIDGERGHLSPEQVQSFVAGQAGVLIWLENTHMAHGGSIMPAGWMSRIGGIADASSARVHLDGSRIWNAVVKAGISPSSATSGAHSMSLSLTKGLGAPAGSMLLGSRDFIARAVEVRSVFGAAWRPVGLLSAAALHSLAGYGERLGLDHARTASLAKAFNEIAEAGKQGFSINNPDTNILLLRAPTPAESERLLAYLNRRDILGLRFGKQHIRLVVHARTGDGACQRLLNAFSDFFNKK